MPLYDASGRNARDDAMLRTQALAMLQKMDSAPTAISSCTTCTAIR